MELGQEIRTRQPSQATGQLLLFFESGFEPLRLKRAKNVDLSVLKKNDARKKVGKAVSLTHLLR